MVVGVGSPAVVATEKRVLAAEYAAERRVLTILEQQRERGKGISPVDGQILSSLAELHRKNSNSNKKEVWDYLIMIIEDSGSGSHVRGQAPH
ncbi:uncharacterized protein LOC107867203 isoform X3 [Capsicum annuum]|uniref:uncharacterized protein LOC107867203 isoform X3 n=1 Tax=Capsicum annuum TaxID=4072 RepID=UPI0007BFB3B4|nr:uncharacterized protein LOC107867203 isoform X3 [Capsicum annuum]